MIVKNIKFINNKVEVVLDNSSFFMSKENYIENPITIDSFITQEKIDGLLEQEKIIETKIELIKLLNRKVLSEYEIRKKIKEKGIKDKDINDVVEALKRSGLINDEYVASLAIENQLLKRKGRLEIIKYLKERGINHKIIEQVISEIDEETYLSNFHKVYEKYLKVYENKSYKVKEQMIINKLREYGYEDEYISTINIEKNNEEEIDLARTYLSKILKNKKIELNTHENINKIKSKLMVKGFSYDIINLVLKEVSDNETY